MATGFRAIILAGFAFGGVGGFVVPDLKLNDAIVQDRGEQALSGHEEPFGALHTTAIVNRDPSDDDAGQTRPEGQPDRPSYGIRLSDKASGLRSRGATNQRLQLHEPQGFVKVLVREAACSCVGNLVLVTQPPA